jgi:antitoxin component YwqK of YwqJK toxin-antitoxin module
MSRHATRPAGSHTERVPPEEGRPVVRRKSWLRFFYQFSLRSLLIATTVVACACWWYLQPETVDEPLAGDYLKLRRQVRTVLRADAQAKKAAGEPETETISDGVYQIVDLHDDVLVSGHTVEGRRQGYWTTYHANGRKAAEGKVVGGARQGLWKTWLADGTLISTTTYQAATPPDTEFRGGTLAAWPISKRQGPASAWHPNGALKLEGHYGDDAREGNWTYFDAQGAALESGQYVAGRREGKWTIRNSQTGETKTVNYIAGRTSDEHEQLLTELAQALQSSSLGRRLSAARQAEDLGPAGWPLLEGAFRTGDDETKLLALRALLKQEAVSDSLMPHIVLLIDHADDRLALRAMLAKVTRGGGLDDRWLDRLIDRASKCGQLQVRVEVLRKACELESKQKSRAFAELVIAVALVAQEKGLDTTSITSLKGDLSPLLSESFASPDAKVRLTVMSATEAIVERGPSTWDADTEIRSWEIPAEMQGLVGKGLHDPDPDVRARAEQIGKHSQSWGCFGGGGIAPSGGVGAGFF